MSVEIHVTQVLQNLGRRPWILSIGVFTVGLTIYIITLAPGLLWGGGDFARFQTKVFTGEIEGNIFGHPMWVVLARPFIWLPIRDVAYRVNLASAVFGATALVFVFQSAWHLTRSSGASLLATGALLVSHTFWTYAVLPKAYSLNALLLAACIYLLLRWCRERRGVYLYIFSIVYGLSLLNHLVMATAAAGFAAFILLVAWRDRGSSPVWNQVILAGALYMVSLAPYVLLVSVTREAEATRGTITAFLRGLFYALTTPDALLLGLVAGTGLLIYQFPMTTPIGIFGLRWLWKKDQPATVLLGLVTLGVVGFLTGATDPRTGGDYIWNLHYYMLMYIAFVLFMAAGFAALRSRLSQPRIRKAATVLMTIVLPVLIYATAPVLVRLFLPDMPGFRDLPGRDNFAYVLSPWKQNETEARKFGDSILSALPPNSMLFADYSIWSMINYLQVVENHRPDVDVIKLPGAGSGEQLPLILAYQGKTDMFLGDTGRYYDVQDLQDEFDIVQTGPIYQLIPK